MAADLALLTAHRTDLVTDRVRTVNRLRDVLTGTLPALERAFNCSARQGALVLLTGYQTPAALRRRGLARLTSWLVNRGVRDADSVAATAMEAAQAQQNALPGEDAAAQIVADLATQILALGDRLKRIDRQIRDAFRTHPQAEIIESLPGMGPILGAECVVAAGDMTAYTDAGHLASAAGLVPAPRDSGRRTGNRVQTSVVMLICEWPRISITTRGATPAAVRRVAVPWRASCSWTTRRPADRASRVKER